MPCRRIGNMIVCGPSIYKFKGWFFEWHSYCGPWPLRKNGDPRKNAGRKFWKVIEEFQKLNKEERKEYEV